VSSVKRRSLAFRECSNQPKAHDSSADAHFFLERTPAHRRNTIVRLRPRERKDGLLGRLRFVVENVFEECDGFIPKQVEEVRAGCSLASGDALNMLATKAGVPRQPANAVVSDLLPQFVECDHFGFHAAENTRCPF
jgi:hypothetical protein